MIEEKKHETSYEKRNDSAVLKFEDEAQEQVKPILQLPSLVAAQAE